jgi:hypothetical protein
LGLGIALGIGLGIGLGLGFPDLKKRGHVVVKIKREKTLADEMARATMREDFHMFVSCRHRVRG